MKKKIFALRFPEFSGEWEGKKLADFLIPTLRMIDKPRNEYLAIGIRSHCKGTFQKTDSDPEKIAMDKLFVVKENDLIVNITFAWEGAIAIAKKEDDGGLVSHRFPTYMFNQSLVLQEYFKYVFVQKRFRFMLEMISPGGAGRNRVMSKTDFLKLKWRFPEIPEQQKIADFLTAVDDKINQLTRKKTLLEQYKKGVMQKIFSQEIRFKDDEGNDFPEWEVKRLGSFLKERIDFPDKELPLYSLTIEDGVVPKSQRYERSFLVNDEESAYKRMCTNDFAFNPMNLRFGALARHRELFDVSVSKYYNIFYCNEKADCRYMEFFLTSYNMIQYYERMATGSLIEKKRVHYLDFVNFKLLFPSLSEQQKIADFLSGIDKKIEQVNSQLEKTREWKNGLLQQMFV